jgi:hypothetical protein
MYIVLGGFLAACGAVSNALHTYAGWPINGQLIIASILGGLALSGAWLLVQLVRD